MKVGERILCAAIWFQDGTKAIHKPRNIEEGTVICGFRHGDCFSTYAAATGLTLRKDRIAIDIINEEQGFLTSYNRFVDRKEGAKIFIACGGQPDNMNMLYSEDLY